MHAPLTTALGTALLLSLSAVGCTSDDQAQAGMDYSDKLERQAEDMERLEDAADKIDAARVEQAADEREDALEAAATRQKLREASEDVERGLERTGEAIEDGAEKAIDETSEAIRDGADAVKRGANRLDNRTDNNLD